jgi:hypothetical protein
MTTKFTILQTPSLFMHSYPYPNWGVCNYKLYSDGKWKWKIDEHMRQVKVKMNVKIIRDNWPIIMLKWMFCKVCCKMDPGQCKSNTHLLPEKAGIITHWQKHWFVHCFLSYSLTFPHYIHINTLPLSNQHSLSKYQISLYYQLSIFSSLRIHSILHSHHFHIIFTHSEWQQNSQYYKRHHFSCIYIHILIEEFVIINCIQMESESERLMKIWDKWKWKWMWKR